MYIFTVTVFTVAPPVTLAKHVWFTRKPVDRPVDNIVIDEKVNFKILESGDDPEVDIAF